MWHMEIVLSVAEIVWWLKVDWKRLMKAFF